MNPAPITDLERCFTPTTSPNVCRIADLAGSSVQRRHWLLSTGALALAALASSRLSHAQSGLSDPAAAYPPIANWAQFKQQFGGREPLRTDAVVIEAPAVALSGGALPIRVRFADVPYPVGVAVFQRSVPVQVAPLMRNFDGTEPPVWVAKLQPRVQPELSFALQFSAATRLLVVVATTDGNLFANEHEIKLGRSKRPA